jgi:hypothetical protein
MKKIIVLAVVLMVSMTSVVPAHAAAPKKSEVRKTVSLKATWYCGKSMHTRGAGGRLTSGKSIALNNSQRKAWGLRYGDRVYVKAPKKYGITGWKIVKDCGCRRGILDAYYVNRAAVPKAFRRAGVVKVKVYIP